MPVDRLLHLEPYHCCVAMYFFLILFVMMNITDVTIGVQSYGYSLETFYRPICKLLHIDLEKKERMRFTKASFVTALASSSKFAELKDFAVREFTVLIFLLSCNDSFLMTSLGREHSLYRSLHGHLA